MQQDTGKDPIHAVMDGNTMMIAVFDQLPRSVERFEFGAKIFRPRYPLLPSRIMRSAVLFIDAPPLLGPIIIEKLCFPNPGSKNRDPRGGSVRHIKGICLTRMPLPGLNRHRFYPSCQSRSAERDHPTICVRHRCVVRLLENQRPIRRDCAEAHRARRPSDTTND